MIGIRRSITFKGIIFSILLATIPLAIAGINIFQVYKEDLKDSVTQIEKEKALLVREKVNGFIKQTTSLLLLLAKDDHLVESHPPHFKAHFRPFLFQANQFLELVFFDEKGLEKFKISAFEREGTSDQKDQSMSPMFQVASKKQIYHGNFYYTSDGKQAMVIAVPVEKPDGRQIGVLKARVLLEPLTDLLHQIKIGERGSVYVVDSEGFLIAHPGEKNILLGPFVDRVIAGEEGVLEFENLRKEKFLVVYIPIPELKWGVVVQVPVEEAYAPLQEVTQTAIKWGLIACISAFALGLFLTRQLISPVKQLSKEMARVSKGDLNVYIKPVTRDEIGDLTESFNRMIQDLRQSQQALQEAEEKYRMIFENSKDMVFITSLEGKFVEVNQAGVEMLGFDHKEELMKTHVRDCYFNPEGRAKFQEEIAPEGFVKDFEIKLKKKDGTSLDCLITATVRRDQAGNIIGYEGTVKNISERKRVEEELIRRTEEAQILYELSSLLNQSLELEKVIPLALEKVLALTGFEMGTIYLISDDREWLELKYDKNYPSHLKEAVKRLQWGEGVTGSAVKERRVVIFSIDEYPSQRVLSHLKEERIKIMVGIPLFSKGEVIGGICLTSRSDRLIAQNEIHLFESFGNQIGMAIQNAKLIDEIRSSEEKYRTVVEGAHEGICIIGPDNRIKFANNGLAEIYGYSIKELIGMDFRDLLNKESRIFMADRFLRREKGEKLPSSFELMAVRKDGNISNIEINARAMKKVQGKLEYIVFVKDVTEKKKMEEQLFQTEKLRALGEMASGVAHDFNNALAAILGNTQLLLYTAQDEEAREALKTIEKVAKGSARTVKRLQEFTRKKGPQELFKLDINSIIREVIEITRPKWRDEAQGKGISIEMISNLEKVSPVAGNASEMREVITNILFNAIEAMPKGGRVEIQTFEKTGKVHIRISDTGLGISEENRKKIFEPFFTTKPFSHTGLGLSMSYGIIKRFGGTVEVESKVGSGTTFTIILPVSVEVKEEIVSVPSTKIERSIKILVIDDEETVRNILAKMLSRVNHQVTIAKNGPEGIELFRKGEFEMVLTDLGMPEMSGWEVCKHMKKINPSIPVGMITGWGLQIDQAQKEEAGLDFVITKPFDFNQIIKVVSETIQSKTPI